MRLVCEFVMVIALSAIAGYTTGDIVLGLIPKQIKADQVGPATVDGHLFIMVSNHDGSQIKSLIHHPECPVCTVKNKKIAGEF